MLVLKASEADLNGEKTIQIEKAEKDYPITIQFWSFYYIIQTSFSYVLLNYFRFIFNNFNLNVFFM